MTSTRRDAAVAATWLALGLILVAAGIYPLWRGVAVFSPSAASAVILLLALVGLSVSRSRAPLLALGLGTPLIALDVLHGGTLGAVLVFTDLIYAAVKYASDAGLRKLLKGAVAVAVGYLLALVFIPATPPVYLVSVQWVLIVGISATWGWNVRSERVRTSAGLHAEHRQHRAELQERIAHDLHDLVANHIAVAGLHIEAAKLLAAGPEIDGERLRETLAKAKVGTDHAHTELRDLISVLTEQPDAPAHERPDSSAFEHLLPLDREVRWHPRRETLDDVLSAYGPLESGVLTRVVAEALANAVKHGNGVIEVDVEPERVRIRNRVFGARTTGGNSTGGSGTGLNGAKRLLAGIGGGLTAGPRAEEDGGWQTTILLPERSTSGR